MNGIKIFFLHFLFDHIMPHNIIKEEIFMLSPTAISAFLPTAPFASRSAFVPGVPNSVANTGDVYLGASLSARTMPQASFAGGARSITARTQGAAGLGSLSRDEMGTIAKLRYDNDMKRATEYVERSDRLVEKGRFKEAINVIERAERIFDAIGEESWMPIVLRRKAEIIEWFEIRNPLLGALLANSSRDTFRREAEFYAASATKEASGGNSMKIHYLEQQIVSLQRVKEPLKVARAYARIARQYLLRRETDDYVDALKYRGNALVSGGRFSAAIKVYDSAITENSVKVIPSRETDEALQELKTAAELMRKNEFVKAARIYVELEEFELAAVAYDSATAYIRKELDDHPFGRKDISYEDGKKLIPLHMNAGRAWARIGRYRDAIDSFRSARHYWSTSDDAGKIKKVDELIRKITQKWRKALVAGAVL